jgi:ABC-2 type transport system permease protein
VLFLATFVIGALSILGAFLVSKPILAGKGVEASILDPDVALGMAGGALYLALLAVFALGLGAILRNSAAGIATSLGIILLLPTLWMIIPGQWAKDAVAYLLPNAGTHLFSVRMPGAPAGLEPWQDLLVVLAWVAVSLAGAALVLRRRDA